jgi:hypothetical protein
VALRQLSSLQEFLFSNILEQVSVIRLCMELLPHLHTIAIKLTPHSYSLHKNDLHIIGNAFALPYNYAPRILQLRHLAIEKIHEVSAHVMSLPELQALYLGSDFEMHPWFVGGLPNLTELYLSSAWEEDLMPVLVHVGRQLQVLHLEIRPDLELDRLLNACPNLSELKIISDRSLGCWSECQPDTLKHLKKLVLEIYCGHDKDYTMQGLLLQILGLALELQSIDLRLIMLHDEDWKEWAALAEKGTCMQNLQEIKIRYDKYFHLSQQSKRLLDEVFASCSINCPQLQLFSVVYDFKQYIF